MQKFKSFREYFFESAPDNIHWPAEINIKNIDGFSDEQLKNVYSDIVLSGDKLTKIPRKFDVVEGDFFIDANELNNLNNCPRIVKGTFDCNSNNLTSLKGAPISVGHNYDCCYNQIKKLTNIPNKINGYFSCRVNVLKSFEGFPSEVDDYIDCSDNEIRSLVDINNYVKSCKNIILSGNPIKKGGLGLLLVKDLESVEYDSEDSFSDAMDIISKYLGQGKAGLLQCQEELIEANLERYSKL